MSLLYKRSNSPFWYVTKTRESTKTANRKQAEEFARKALTEHWRVSALGEHCHAWSALASAWLDTKGHKRALNRDQFIISDATDYLRRRDLDAADLNTLGAETWRGYGALVKARASASTANRHLAVVRAMMRKAADWGWLLKVPAFELYPVTRDAPRWLTPAEFDKLAGALPTWARDMAIMAVQTGLRYSNIAGMKWEWVNADGTVVTVPATATKTARTYTAPLSKVAQKILAGLRPEGNQSPSGLIFKRDGVDGPIPTLRFWWDKACEESGVSCRFHDLRHTWASWHVQNGTPDRVVQECGGWASPAMLQRYAHLSTKHLTDYADNLNGATT